MYVRVPGALGPASGIVNDQHAAHVASIIAIKNQQEAIAKTVSDENNRIRIEQEVRGVCGYGNESEDDSEPEPWKDHMEQGSSRRKCNKCRKPYWEWRLGQDACEMCQLKAGWNKGFDSKQDKAERAARRLRGGGDSDDSNGDEPTAQPATSHQAQPKATPMAKPKAMPMAQTPAARGAKGKSKGSGRHQKQTPWWHRS